MGKPNRTCLMCGTAYRYCPQCQEDKYKPSWMDTFCSEDCMMLFKTLNKHTFGQITTSDARDVIAKIQLPDMNSLRESSRHHIDEILAWTPESENTMETVDEIVEEEKQEEAVEDSTNDSEGDALVKVTSKKKYKKKKKSSFNV